MRYEEIPVLAYCPICHSRAGLRLYTVNVAEAAQHFVLAETHPDRHIHLRNHIAKLWRQETCDIIRCTSCRFTYAHPFVAGDEKFYTLAYERTGYRGWTWEYGCTRDQIAFLINVGKLDHPEVLEIGAGDGVFVRALAPSLTPKESVLCTEFSEYGRGEILKYGVACLDCDVRSRRLDLHLHRFDVICMFQVLEHLDRLDELFVRLNELTKPEAHLFVAVPNERRIEFNERHGSLLDLPPNHTGRWTRPCFETMGDRYGWRLVAHELEDDGAAARAIQFATYRYMRRRQDPRSVANYVERIDSRHLRRPLQAAMAALYAASSPQVLARMISTEGLGNSQWVHLEKARR